MDAAKAAAHSANARELAPQIYAAAEKEEAAAREDYRQQRFAAAAGRMEATATLFRSAVTAADAETEARAARRGLPRKAGAVLNRPRVKRHPRRRPSPSRRLRPGPNPHRRRRPFNQPRRKP